MTTPPRVLWVAAAAASALVALACALALVPRAGDDVPAASDARLAHEAQALVPAELAQPSAPVPHAGPAPVARVALPAPPSLAHLRISAEGRRRSRERPQLRLRMPAELAGTEIRLRLIPADGSAFAAPHTHGAEVDAAGVAEFWLRESGHHDAQLETSRWIGPALVFSVTLPQNAHAPACDRDLRARIGIASCELLDASGGPPTGLTLRYQPEPPPDDAEAPAVRATERLEVEVLSGHTTVHFALPEVAVEIEAPRRLVQSALLRHGWQTVALEPAIIVTLEVEGHDRGFAAMLEHESGVMFGTTGRERTLAVHLTRRGNWTATVRVAGNRSGSVSFDAEVATASRAVVVALADGEE